MEQIVERILPDFLVDVDHIHTQFACGDNGQFTAARNADRDSRVD